MQFKIGDKVKYISGEWYDSENNPLWGNEHGKIKGTIYEIQDIGLNISVKWDNGTQNTYNTKDLELIKKEKVDIRKLNQSLI